MESILTSIKKLLGIEEDFDGFDKDLIIGINTTFSVLTQLGVGPQEGFSIKSKDATWCEFIGDETKLEMVKSYVQLKVKMLFDPPLSSALIAVFQEQIKELEWRISEAVELEEEETADERT